MHRGASHCAGDDAEAEAEAEAERLSKRLPPDLQPHAAAATDGVPAALARWQSSGGSGSNAVA
jgi:hypothetical protein